MAGHGVSLPLLRREALGGFLAFRLGDEELAVFGQQEPLGYQLGYGLLDPAHVAGMIAVTLLERGARIAPRLALGAGCCERDVGAVAVAQISFGERRLVEVPARVGRERHRD